MDKSTLIKTQGLVKRYPVGGGHFTALKGLDLNVNSGEFVGLVGPSGSGKTTLLNIIGALDAPSEGTVEVLGKDLATLSGAQAAKHRSAFMGFIFQTYNLLPVYTAFENVEFPLLLLGKSTEERKQLVMQALDWVGIADKADSRPKMLSGGESQRVAIARALINDPLMILADEPTGNLDNRTGREVVDLLFELVRSINMTLIMVTHNLELAALCRRQLLIEEGALQ